MGLQVHYRRQETATKPARTETVVVFFPDVWNVMPNKLEFDGITAKYGEACQAKLEGRKVEQDQDEEEEVEEKVAEDARPEDGDDGMEVDGEVAKSDPTHWKLLDPKTMKVN